MSQNINKVSTKLKSISQRKLKETESDFKIFLKWFYQALEATKKW